MMTFSSAHVQLSSLGWGHSRKGLPGFRTRTIHRSKCSHLVARCPRIQASLSRGSATPSRMVDKSRGVCMRGGEAQGLRLWLNSTHQAHLFSSLSTGMMFDFRGDLRGCQDVTWIQTARQVFELVASFRIQRRQMLKARYIQLIL